MNIIKQCRKIVCVGRNYLDHVKELNNALPKEPLIFLKPSTTLLPEGAGAIQVPNGCTSLHHEVELGILIGKDGRNISQENALDHVDGYALALDMTARDFQDDIKKKGHPWVLAKCWDTFCPISEFIAKSSIPDPHNVQLWLKVDGVMKQNGNTKDMIFQLPKIINYVSSIMTLQKGDLILTGTPHGVGAVKSGQVIQCGLEGITEMTFKVE